jgi:hypothetical protein
MKAAGTDILRDMGLMLALLLMVFFLALVTSAVAYQPGPADLIINAGEDYYLEFYEANNGVRIDQTGTTWASQCMAAPGGAVFFNLSASLKDSTTIKGTLSKAQSSKNSGKAGVWWVRRTDSGGKVSYRIAGKCSVIPR